MLSVKRVYNKGKKRNQLIMSALIQQISSLNLSSFVILQDLFLDSLLDHLRVSNITQKPPQPFRHPPNNVPSAPTRSDKVLHILVEFTCLPEYLQREVFELLLGMGGGIDGRRQRLRPAIGVRRCRVVWRRQS
jgi:hypothetical protein